MHISFVVLLISAATTIGHPLSELLPIRIGLKQQNLHLGNDLLADISDPLSPSFGEHYSSKEVIDLFAPSDETVTAVLSWLDQSGIDIRRITQSENKGWLAFDATADEAESFLHTEYFQYEHTKSGQKTLACDHYFVPKDIQHHIDYITPGVKLSGYSPAPKSKQKSKRSRVRPLKIDTFKPEPNDTSTCDQAITPACIRGLYQIPINNLSHPSNTLGIFETGDLYAQEDLDTFFAEYEPRIANGTHPDLASIDGGIAPKSPKLADGESDLDFELGRNLQVSLITFCTRILKYSTTL